MIKRKDGRVSKRYLEKCQDCGKEAFAEDIKRHRQGIKDTCLKKGPKQRKKRATKAEIKERKEKVLVKRN